MANRTRSLSLCEKGEGTNLRVCAWIICLKNVGKTLRPGTADFRGLMPSEAARSRNTGLLQKQSLRNQLFIERVFDRRNARQGNFRIAKRR